MQTTYRYIRVRQIGQNVTYAELKRYDDGKDTGMGASRSYQGNLVTWSDNMVTTDFNGFVRTFDVNGFIISQYRK